METTQSLEIEASRHIGLLRFSNMRIVLLSVSAPQLAAATLSAAVCAAAGRTDLVGSLADGSVGLLSVQPMRAGAALTFEQRFISQLKSRLMAIADGRPIGRLWLRTVERWAAELAEPSDLFDALDATPRTAVVLGLPAALTAGMATEPELPRSRSWFDLHAYGTARTH